MPGRLGRSSAGLVLTHVPCFFIFSSTDALHIQFPFIHKICYNSRMNVDDPRVGQNLAEIAAEIAKIDDADFVVNFLQCLLTPAEVADVAARWALVKSLKQKVPHREIAKDFGISLCKITRGSRVLKDPESAFAQIFSTKRQTQEGEEVR